MGDRLGVRPERREAPRGDETQDLERIEFDDLDAPVEDEEVRDLLAAVRLPRAERFDPFASQELDAVEGVDVGVDDVPVPAESEEPALESSDRPSRATTTVVPTADASSPSIATTPAAITGGGGGSSSRFRR